MTIQIRPGLELETHVIPGSARIQCRLPNPPQCMFDPIERSWLPCDPTGIADFLAQFTPADLALIETRLLQYSEERRRWFAAQRGESGHNGDLTKLQ